MTDPKSTSHREIEEICEKAAEEAYELGWDTAEPIDGEFSEDSNERPPSSMYTANSGRWDSHVLPKLRTIAGFEDPSGKGTYQETLLDLVPEILSEDVIPAFQAGYDDRAYGNDYGESHDLLPSLA